MVLLDLAEVNERKSRSYPIRMSRHIRPLRRRLCQAVSLSCKLNVISLTRQPNPRRLGHTTIKLPGLNLPVAVENSTSNLRRIRRVEHSVSETADSRFGQHRA